MVDLPDNACYSIQKNALKIFFNTYKRFYKRQRNGVKKNEQFTDTLQI